MPFKTKRDKSRAHDRWARFTQDSLASYKSTIGKKDRDYQKVVDKQPEISERLVIDTNYIKSELLRIGVLASLVIGLEIILKIYHIGI